MKFFLTAPKTSIIANEAARTGETGEWLLASRYGVYSNKLGRQKVSKAIAERLVAAFETEKAAAINEQGAFEGLPVFVGHPDVEPQKYPDHRRYGSILGMEAREKALFVRVAWNDLGTHNKQQKHFVYPSVAWEIEPHKDGTVIPARLVSVGLTNRPNMRDVPAWVNEAATEEPNNEPTDNQPTTKDDDMKLMQRLRELLALTEDANEETILAAMEAHFAEGKKMTDDMTEAQAAATAANERATTLEAQLATATNERDAVAAKLTATNEARRDEALRVAINEGRITEADKPALLVAFNEDADKAFATLAERKKTHDTGRLDLDGKKARVAQMAANEKNELVQVAVNERMSASGEDYTKAYLAVKKLKPELFATA